jgi:hypothetical protein
MLYEIGLVVTRISGHFMAKPVRSFEGLVLAHELNLRNDQSSVVLGELVDFSVQPAVPDSVTPFLDQGALAQGVEYFIRIMPRYLIFEFLSRGAFGNTLDCQIRRISCRTRTRTVRSLSRLR